MQSNIIALLLVVLSIFYLPIEHTKYVKATNKSAIKLDCIFTFVTIVYKTTDINTIFGYDVCFC